MTRTDLAQAALHLDRKTYGAYRSLEGSWDMGRFVFELVRAQRDPFAPPSTCRATVTAGVAALPPRVLASREARVAVSCQMARRMADAARNHPTGPGSGGSGRISIIDLEQLVLENTGVQVLTDGSVQARFGVGLPAQGRRILGQAAHDLLTDRIPDLVRRVLTSAGYDEGQLEEIALINEDTASLRDQLRIRGLVAFVADGSTLPRRSGVDQRPLEKDRAVPFSAPETLAVTLERPNGGPVRGMGVPEGVTLIVGGGYHGKSTLLEAMVRGVFNHAPGDGREGVVSTPTAVAVRAEDGRAVSGVDISDFMDALPGGVDTRAFTTSNASGSTSQAAAIAEAAEARARALFIDEDTAATNFLIRDRRMQALVPKDREPITPLVDRVQALHREHGISTVLVLGGSGDYLDVADTVIGMDGYRPLDLTRTAKRIAGELPTGRRPETGSGLELGARRLIDPASLDPSRRGKSRTRARGVASVEWGEETLDLTALAALLLPAQTRSIVHALRRIRAMADRGPLQVSEVLTRLENELTSEGLDVLDPGETEVLAVVRVQEVLAALNRLRSLRILAPLD